jgi:hypothetical protein
LVIKPLTKIMRIAGIEDVLLIAAIFSAISIIAGYYLTRWFHKINERITQQHETNRLLRKLAGEPEVFSSYLNEARAKKPAHVSDTTAAALPSPVAVAKAGTSKILTTVPDESVNDPEVLKRYTEQ